MDEPRLDIVVVLRGPVRSIIVREKQKIGGAIRTDFILSAEIIAITLGTVAESSFTTQVLVLVGIACGSVAAAILVILTRKA